MMPLDLSSVISHMPPGLMLIYQVSILCCALRDKKYQNIFVLTNHKKCYKINSLNPYLISNQCSQPDRSREGRQPVEIKQCHRCYL